MSLRIDPEKVTAVLLPDGWHDVDAGQFFLDSYEFVNDDYASLSGGEDPLVPAVGFTFKQGPSGRPGARISGPLTSVLAVSHDS